MSFTERAEKSSNMVNEQKLSYRDKSGGKGDIKARLMKTIKGFKTVTKKSTGKGG